MCFVFDPKVVILLQTVAMILSIRVSFHFEDLSRLTFQDRPGRVDEGGRVEVGVAEGVEGLVVAEVVGVVVRVAADEGVGVADRPDDLAAGLEVVGGVVLATARAAGGGGPAGLQQLPLVRVIEVDPRVRAARGVGIDVGLDPAVQGVVLVPGVDAGAVLHLHEAVPGVVGARVRGVEVVRLGDRRHVAAGVVGRVGPRGLLGIGLLGDAGDLVGVVDGAVLVQIVGAGGVAVAVGVDLVGLPVADLVEREILFQAVIPTPESLRALLAHPVCLFGCVFFAGLAWLVYDAHASGYFNTRRLTGPTRVIPQGPLEGKVTVRCSG